MLQKSLVVLSVSLASFFTGARSHVPLVETPCSQSCKVDIGETNAGPSGSVIAYDVPLLPGHGVCECLFAYCTVSSHCSEELSVSFKAPEGFQLCGVDGRGYGGTEVVTLNVSVCGGHKSAYFGVCPSTKRCDDETQDCELSYLSVSIDCSTCASGTCHF